jgi:hypothetical protein
VDLGGTQSGRARSFTLARRQQNGCIGPRRSFTSETSQWTIAFFLADNVTVGNDG